MNCDDLEGIKQDAARAQHMTLIAVPCWWQGDKMRYNPSLSYCSLLLLFMYFYYFFILFL